MNIMGFLGFVAKAKPALMMAAVVSFPPRWVFLFVLF
jgi:hypothetical protein